MIRVSDSLGNATRAEGTTEGRLTDAGLGAASWGVLGTLGMESGRSRTATVVLAGRCDAGGCKRRSAKKQAVMPTANTAAPKRCGCAGAHKGRAFTVLSEA